MENFEHFFKQDIMLFQEFNKTFWQKVEQYGTDRMDADVKYLKEFYAECTQNSSLEKCQPKIEANKKEPVKIQFRNRMFLPYINLDKLVVEIYTILVS